MGLTQFVTKYSNIMTDPRSSFCICQHNARISQYQVNRLVLFSWDFLNLSKLEKQRSSFRWLTGKLQDSLTSVNGGPYATEKDQVFDVENTVLTRSFG